MPTPSIHVEEIKLTVPDEEMVEPIVYYYSTGAGHVAIGGVPSPYARKYIEELNKKDPLVYLSYGRAGGRNSGLVREDGTPPTAEIEKIIYCKHAQQLKLPPCKKSDFKKAYDEFVNRDRNHYNLATNNCRDAVEAFMKTTGYINRQEKIIDPTPYGLAKRSQKIIQKHLAERRKSIRENVALNSFQKMTQLIENDRDRLNAEISDTTRAKADAEMLRVLLVACCTYEINSSLDPSTAGKYAEQEILLEQFVKAARQVDKKTAAHLHEALKLFHFGCYAPVPQDITHANFLDNLQKSLILQSVAGNKLIIAANRGDVEVEQPLLHGAQMYPRMKEIVKEAKYEVLLSGYKIDKDSDAEKDLIEALKYLNNKPLKNNKKIRVCILIDRKKGPASFFAKATASNSFREGLVPLSNLDIQYAEHEHTAFGSYHQKMIVVDGEKAILSSADLMQKSNYKDAQSRWVDMSSVLQGEAFVDYIRNDFRKAWASSYSQSLTGNKMSIPATLNKPALPGVRKDTAPALFLSKKAHGNAFSRKNLSPFALALIQAINHAKTTINIMTPNLNNPEIISALVNAVKRGVQVHIVMAKNMNDKWEKKPLAGGTNQTGIQALYNQLGRPAKNLDVRWVTDINGSLIQGDLKDSNMLHARMITVDDEIVLTGSSVLDQQSVHQSREADVVVQSKRIAEIYNKNIFNAVFSKAINIFNDPLNTIKAAGPVIGLTRNIKIEHLNETPFIEQNWCLAPSSAHIFRVLSNATDKQINMALQELRNMIDTVTIPNALKSMEPSILIAESSRVSRIMNKNEAFGLLEQCIQPQQEITSRLIMPSEFKVNAEEARLAELIHQQVQQGLKAMGATSVEEIKMTLHSLSPEDVTERRNLDTYEKAYIQYCLKHSMECLDAKGNIVDKEALLKNRAVEIFQHHTL